MKKYNQIFVLIGILILIIAGISIVFFPEWSSGPAMLLKLVGLVVGAVLASVHYFFSIIKNYHDIRKNDISESPLTAVRPDELLARLGKGGEVKWIEREAAISSLLKRYGRLVITGKIKSGKTREAIEVIQQVVAEDLIRSDRIFEPAFALLLLTRKDLEVVILRKIDTKIPLLLFIDDLPFHYKNEDLKKLTELMNILQLHCKDLYVVATSRLDQINVNHDIWFYENEFFRVELTDLSSEQSGRIIDSAAEVYGLDIDVPVRQKLRSLSDGTPELPITSLRRFYALGTTLVKMEDMDQVVNTSIHDAWAMIRRQIQNQNPVAGLVIKALATFHHFNIVPYTDLVLDYTRYLNSQKKEKKLITIVSINNSIYSALEYIRKFDVVENNSIFSFPDVLVEESINQSGANKEFDNYLKLHSYGINKQLLIRIYTGLGRYYVDNHKKVLLYMNKLIALIPNYAMAYHMRAHAYHKLGEIEKAKVDYSQAIHLDLNNASYYYCRGELYRHIGDNERAFEDFNKAVQLDPNSSEAYHRRGHYHKDQKELQKALDDINIAIKLDPEEFHNYVLRGQIHYEQGNFDKALADVERVQKVKNVKYNKAWVYDLQGHMYMKLHRHKEALNSFNLAVDFNPASAMYLFCRSEFFYETGDLSLAFEDLNVSVQMVR